MHDDEVDTDADLARRLLASQHPQWADLRVERVPSAGTDNAIYRLGADKIRAIEAVLADSDLR
jgi:aminoglycoside phosphotransferase (APT) family kinase protein